MFYPARGDNHSSSVGTWLLLITAAFGLSGIAVDVMEMMGNDGEKGFAPGIVIVISGIAAYIILLFGTIVFLHRIVTTELLLIVGWTMLEVAVANAAYAKESLNGSLLLLFLAVIGIASLISLILYLMYYNVKPSTGYILGMIPLITEGLTMGLFLILTR